MNETSWLIGADATKKYISMEILKMYIVKIEFYDTYMNTYLNFTRKNTSQNAKRCKYHIVTENLQHSNTNIHTKELHQITLVVKIRASI